MRAVLATLSLTAVILASCDDPASPPRPSAITAVSATQQNAALGGLVADTPAVRVTAANGRPVPGVAITFVVESGGGSIAGAETVTNADGIARVTSWLLGNEPGPNLLVARAAGLPGASVTFEATALPDGCQELHVLDQPLGHFVRLKSAATTILPCLLFDPLRAAGQDYLLLLESLPPTGSFEGGLFPGPFSGSGFGFTLRVEPRVPAAAGPLSAVRLDFQSGEVEQEHAWDFGAGRIREHRPATAPEAVSAPHLLRAGQRLELSSAATEPAVGDTLVVRMEGLPRLGIPTGNQQAVIRHVSPHIIIAEDVRLTTTLTRESGSRNTPLTPEDLEALAEHYAANAMVQGDLFFENRHNTAVEEIAPHRVVAIHSLMPADDIWGYTYSSTNYFVWDFWVATDGSTRSLNQHPQRVTDNLFMHEIAHMRHWGMLQRAGSPPRGNRWLVEGFARFIERLPIAARLLNTLEPSRTGNVVLPLNPAFGNAYFLDDVPTYGSAGAGMFFGYQTSAFVFDYFADQVALQGDDWRVAMREFLTAAGSQATLDPLVQKWLGYDGFAELFTRARVALYTDDIATPGLPPWTQYHTYQLRESRALPQQLEAQDPRNAWVRISPADGAEITGGIGTGAALGFVIDGAGNPPAALLTLEAPSGPRVHVSLVRIR
jgi:hypothetical protein